MSNSNGCKMVLVALVVAIVVGSLGFAAGFATHTVLVAARPAQATASVPQDTAVQLPSPVTESPTAEPTVPLIQPTTAMTATVPSGPGSTFDLFWEAWNLVQSDYYGELPSEEDMTYGALRGAISTLGDPYTAFIEPSIAEIMREDASGSFEGIGAFVSMQDGLLTIARPMKGQPAEMAGLQRGDVVTQVDDTSLKDMSLYEAIALIRGPAGTTVRLTIARAGQEPFGVEIVRALIDIPVVESQMLESGIAYVSLIDFSSDANAKLQSAIEELLAQNPKGLILDLRGNGGGWLNEALLVSGLFLPKDQVVVIERYKDAPDEVLRTSNDPVASDIPMVVLVDGASASASEIVAGALQDYGRAVLIGEKTFGKGSVQWARELSNGAELRVTIARWFTPKDRAIHGQGLEPDIAVKLTEEDVAAGLDPQLDRAVNYLLTGQ
jgi:carboxyl-terminal processing protease